MTCHWPVWIFRAETDSPREFVFASEAKSPGLCFCFVLSKRFARLFIQFFNNQHASDLPSEAFA